MVTCQPPPFRKWPPTRTGTWELRREECVPLRLPRRGALLAVWSTSTVAVIRAHVTALETFLVPRRGVTQGRIVGRTLQPEAVRWYASRSPSTAEANARLMVARPPVLSGA